MPDSLFEFVDNLNDQQHIWFECEKDAHRNLDYDNDCNYCDYGLRCCKICGGCEGSLTTHCRGVELDETMLEMVAMGQADYIDGNWIVPAAVRSLRFNK